VVMPALNEEKNIRDAAESVLKALTDAAISGELVIINDGSSDKTGEIIKDICSKDPRVSFVTHSSPQGIGASFWDGVDHCNGDAVVMLPGDNENDPWEIFRYFKLLEHVDIVIPFIYNRETRSLFRNALSFGYRFIINTTFMVYLNYTNGTVIYRKSILKKITYRSKSFFFQTDILIRLLKAGYLFAEVPYRLGMRKGGKSKAVSFPSLLQVMKGYMRLVKNQYFKTAQQSQFPDDTQTSLRRNSK